MPLPSDSAMGIDTTRSEFVDLNSLPVIRNRISPADRSMTKEQAASYQKGEIGAPEAPPPQDAPLYPQQPAPAAPAPSPAAGPAPAGTLPVPGAPPVYPQDTSNVRKRIGKLFGQVKTLEEQLRETQAALGEARAHYQPTGPPPPPPAPQNPYSFQEPQAPPQNLSRGEFMELLHQQTRFLLEQQQIAVGQQGSRQEAERDFPDVYADPELRETTEHIFRSDPALRGDPHGPYKAALMARGAAADPFSRPAPGPGQVDFRKVQAAGVGPSIPEGSAQPVPTRETRYAEAMERFRRTGRMEDAALARRIQMGPE